MKVKTLVLVALLAAVATLIRLLPQIPVFFVPGMIQLDISDLPVMIGGLAMGPWAAVGIALVKNLIAFIAGFSTVRGVGELADFLMALSLVLPASWIYFRHKSRRVAVWGLGAGVLSMAVVSSLLNAFLLFPIYTELFFGGDMEILIGLFRAVNGHINSMSEAILFAMLPFNLVKGVLIAGITLLVYKRLSPLLKT